MPVVEVEQPTPAVEVHQPTLVVEEDLPTDVRWRWMRRRRLRDRVLERPS
jgi:hypothetical protein